MSVLAGLFDDLNHMSLVQLLLVFAACTCAAFALGNLLAPRPRAFAAASALALTGAFIATSEAWANAVMLAAIAIAGLGVFTLAVLLLTRLIGLEPRGRNAAVRPDSAFASDDAAPTTGPAAPARHPPGRVAST